MLAFKEIWGNKVLKKVLCVDLGSVLIDFDEKHVARLLKKNRIKRFVENDIVAHDKGLLSLWELYQKAKFEKYFSREVLWEEFVLAYNKCIIGVHEPMYETLLGLKTRGVRLVCVTDNNHFAVAQTTMKCPKIFPLFRENKKDQIVLSYELHSLKEDGNPFVHAPKMHGFANEEACFVDDHEYNFLPAIANGFDQDACFLYKIKSKHNHAQFLKFLARHFPS